MRITQIYRHNDSTYHHSNMELIYFKRNNARDDFRLVRKAPLDGQALETLVAALCSVPRFADIKDASSSLVLPANGVKISPEVLARLTPALGQLLSSAETLDAIIQGQLTPGALDNLSAATQQARYKEAAAELRRMIDDPQLAERLSEVVRKQLLGAGNRVYQKDPYTSDRPSLDSRHSSRKHRGLCGHF